MIGLLLVAVAEVFSEISNSLGKYEVREKHESVYALGFLNALWIAVFFLCWGVLGDGGLVFSRESMPTFLARAVLEIVLIFVSIHAITQADRSTFSFLRILTIPLLLLVDLALGYAITLPQIFGISFITIALTFLLLERGLSGRGKMLSLLTAVLAAGTISLYKYNIEHFNSVAAEQGLMYLIVLAALIIGARIRLGENVFKYLFKPVFLFQSLAAGVGGVLMSFAYTLAPASIIAAAKRPFEVLGSIASGQIRFHEKHLAIKLLAFLLILAGVLLTMLFPSSV